MHIFMLMEILRMKLSKVSGKMNVGAEVFSSVVRNFEVHLQADALFMHLLWVGTIYKLVCCERSARLFANVPTKRLMFGLLVQTSGSPVNSHDR